MSNDAMSACVFFIQGVLALTLIAAGVAKLVSRELVQRAFGELPGLSGNRHVIGITVVIVPIVEIMAGFGAALGFSHIAVSLTMVMLFLVFDLVTLHVLFVEKRENFRCNCFGPLASGPMTKATLAWNLVLTVAALVVLLHALSIREQLDRNSWYLALLLGGYGLFGLGVAQAVQTFSYLNELASEDRK